MTTQKSQNVELFESILALMGKLKRFVSAVADNYGLSLPQVQVVWQLGLGPVSMGAVADELHCDPSNVTGIVQRLEQMGLIERRPDVDDRRIKTLILTDKGEKVRSEILERVDRELPLTSVLNTTERSQLQSLLLKAIS